MRNLPEILILMMGIATAGGVVVFLYAWWTSKELAYAVKDSGAKIIFADVTRAERLMPSTRCKGLTLIGVRDIEETLDLVYSKLLRRTDKKSWPERGLQSDDELAIMYSSGTTGQPKSVLLTHRGEISAVFSWLMRGPIVEMLVATEGNTVETRPHHVILIATPLFHVTATHPNFLLSLATGAKLFLLAKWNAKGALKINEEERVTRFLGVPTQSAHLMEATKSMQTTLSWLEFLAASGAKRPSAQVNKLKTSFPHTHIATGWCITETNACGFGFFGNDNLKILMLPGGFIRLCRICKFWTIMETNCRQGKLEKSL